MASTKGVLEVSMQQRRTPEKELISQKMAAQVNLLSSPCSEHLTFPHTPLSPDAEPFTPLGAEGSRFGCLPDAGRQFARISSKLRSLSTDSLNLKEELNLLFDQLISENYSKTFNPNVNIQPEEVCMLLGHASRLVPLNQEHLVIKFCQLMHHLLNQLKFIVDEDTLDVLMTYVVNALGACSTWTHTGVLLALSTVVYGNGPQCYKHLRELLCKDGVLLRYSAPLQPDVELRRVALSCMANICVGIPGRPSLEDQYRTECFRVFLQALQSPKPANTDELFYCMLMHTALKGLQACLFGWKWRFGGGEELGSLLATQKRLMFLGAPGVSVEWPPVLYPTPLPQYEGLCVPKPFEPPAETATQAKASGSKKKKSRGKAKKAGREENRADNGEEDERDNAPSQRGGGGGGGGGGGAVGRREDSSRESWSKTSTASFYPCWKTTSSDSELSDPEGRAQSKLRLYQGRVRQSALHSLLAVVKGVEKKTLYGYWSSFIPDAPIGGPPPLNLLTVILKDPSPKVRACALQVLSAMLDDSRQFLGVAEDTAAPRVSFTPFSLTIATAIRELHRALTLALLAETSAYTLTQVIKCLAYLVCNAPYHRLRPGLLSPLWRQMRSFLRHKDVNLRVSVLTLYGALVRSQAPLPEVQLLLRQPEGSGGGGGTDPHTPQESALSWRQRGAPASPAHTHGNSRTQTPRAPLTPGEEEARAPWLLQLCVSLVTQPRQEHSDSEGGGTGGGGTLEPSPIRLEALQILAYLVRGYFPLVQRCLCELGHLSARCLGETDSTIQLHGAKLLEELGTSIIQQYNTESKVPESNRVPISQVVQFWTEILNGPLNGALQSEQHPTLQSSACDTLASILPEAFAQLPAKVQMMCITVLLGLTYGEHTLVKAAAVRALGVYIKFPCLREDVMFVADTANTVLTALEDQSRTVRAKAAWSLGSLTDTLIVTMESAGVEFQEELSDMLLLKMLQSATRASFEKDRVKAHAVRALGNLLRFLRCSQLSRSVFQRPLEDAVRALVQTIQSESTMKVRWNACYALGNAFRNPALPIGSALWARDAFASLCSVVTSCKNYKVRIKSAAALSVPAHRSCYGDVEQFKCVWQSLATAVENSEDTSDFLEYRYCASLRHTLSQALVHLLSLSQSQDMPHLGAALAGEKGMAVNAHLIKYLTGGEGAEREREREDEGDGVYDPQQRCAVLQQSLERLKGLEFEGDDDEETGRNLVVDFLENLLKSCEELKVTPPV